MGRNIFAGVGLLIIVMACIITAGCTNTPGAVTADPTPTPTERVSGVTDDSAAGDVSAGNTLFASDLYRQLASDPQYKDKNLFFSPYSLSSALAITYEGARGTTADEMRSVLHLPADDALRREGFSEINTGLNHEKENYILSTANALWVEETYPLLPGYVDVIEHWYSAGATNLDFIDSPEESRKRINNWVEDQTENRIRDLLPSGSVDPLTRLVITNAVYFKGAWVKAFDPNKTKEGMFRVGSNDTVFVPMMHRVDENATYGYNETDTLQVLEMPYSHGNSSELAMIVLLPREDNLAVAEEALEKITDLRKSLVEQRVKVSLPKFKLETTYYLPETLTEMGMPTAFTDAADFSGIAGTKDLFISEVVHKGFIDVNEEGTESAAATGVVVGLTSARPDATPVFRADHPFVFLIVDKETDIVLFVGRVVDPIES